MNAVTAPPPPFKTCNCCPRSYTMAQWNMLPLVGYQDLDDDGDGKLELRNCPCGNTCAVEI